jgi:hypothetical protein
MAHFFKLQAYFSRSAKSFNPSHVHHRLFIFSSQENITVNTWEGENDMKSSENCSTYNKYMDAQIELSSAEDLLLITACNLVRLKDETGMNLFWDNSEEEFLRDYIASAESFSQN